MSSLPGDYRSLDTQRGQELWNPSAAAKRNPEKPKSPSMSDLPVATHTHTSNPKEVSENHRQGDSQPGSRPGYRTTFVRRV